MKKWLPLLALLVTLLGAPLSLWALIPEAMAPPQQAFTALKTAAAEQDFLIAAVEPAAMRPPPIWVRYHPRRMWRSFRNPPPTAALTSEAEGATRYLLTHPDGVEITCEMQRREGAVVWVWLDGPSDRAAQIKTLRGQLRAAMPWVPVSCPWQ